MSRRPYLERFRERLRPEEEFRASIETAKSELATAQSWVFAHPEVWSAEFADEVREALKEIRDALDDLVSRAYDEARAV